MYQLELCHLDGSPLPSGHHAIFVTSGSIRLNGSNSSASDGVYMDTTVDSASIDTMQATGLRFSLIKVGASDSSVNTIASEAVELPAGPAVIRLDQVSFPPAATAWRHTHPGPGIRYLLSGALTLVADEHSHTVEPGDAWFEAARSPVKAIASTTEPSAFVRCMILPPEFEGKPTINILDPVDREKPALQKNQRFVDQRVELQPAG